jgi:hypothetical protein
MKRLSKYAFLIALTAVVWIPVRASAQTLTLDDFTTGAYVKRIKNPNVHDLHLAALPAKSPLGQARQTYFGAAPNPDGQWSTLDVGSGRLVVDSGFGCGANLELGYGYTLAGAEAPLTLNLDGYGLPTELSRRCHFRGNACGNHHFSADRRVLELRGRVAA